MSGDDRRKFRGHNHEGRAHALERWRQARDRAELDRDARPEHVTEDDVVVEDSEIGDRLKPVPGPQELGGLLGDIVRARGWDKQLRSAQLQERWPDIVGPELALRSRPGRLDGGILQVIVEAPRWATQLSWMTEQLVGRIVAETSIPVREVRLVVGDVHADET